AIGAFADDAEPDPRYIIVAFGDSTTAPRTVDGQPLDVYAEHLKRALASGEGRANVINAGVPGHTTRDGLARMNRDVLAHKPNIVIIQFGINDAAVDVWKNPPATVERVPLAEYKRNLRKMVDAVRQQGGRAVLMTPNPMRWTDALRKLYNKPPYEPDEVDGLNV